MLLNIEHSFYCVIPSFILKDKEVSDGAKILYGHISGLTQLNGECWASNNYFADLIDKSIPTIKRQIKELKIKNYISVEINYKNDGKEVESRVIKLCIIPQLNLNFTPVSKMNPPRIKNDTTPGSKMIRGGFKNEPYNNTYYKTIYNTTTKGENELKTVCLLKFEDKKTTDNVDSFCQNDCRANKSCQLYAEYQRELDKESLESAKRMNEFNFTKEDMERAFTKLQEEEVS